MAHKHKHNKSYIFHDENVTVTDKQLLHELQRTFFIILQHSPSSVILVQLLCVVSQKAVLGMKANWCTSACALLAHKIGLLFADIALLLLVDIHWQMVQAVKTDLSRYSPTT